MFAFQTSSNPRGQAWCEPPRHTGNYLGANLAADRHGGSVQVIVVLLRESCEWVQRRQVFSGQFFVLFLYFLCAFFRYINFDIVQDVEAIHGLFQLVTAPGNLF